jgi:hypothetical protein
MKKLSFLIALGFFALLATAKPAFQADQFRDYATQMQTLTQKYLDANEADNAAKVVEKWMTDYYKLPAVHQKMMKSELASFYFTQSRVYAAQNNTAKAVKAMKEAIQNGFKDYQSAASAPELSTVRSDGEFAKLLDSIKG